MAPLRHEQFNSLAELNHAIAFARERVNTRPFQKLAGSRRSVFDATERAALRPLPATRYELADWRTAKVNIDYTSPSTCSSTASRARSSVRPSTYASPRRRSRSFARASASPPTSGARGRGT